MHINPDQMARLADTSFNERMVQVLAAADPKAPAELRSEAGQRTLNQLTDRARAHGLQSELDIGRFIVTAWVLGPDFDTRFPAMREILAEPRLSPTQKADAVETLTTTLMNNLHRGKP
ncbi:hypothetical protein BurJ1DRAFT_1294 [Burkholderiales bacterium JOSHI_001]|nr:hypothetical protein BurJ1DRAFT_1294 [Burkholderiales bacterium JOSHI_001]